MINKNLLYEYIGLFNDIDHHIEYYNNLVIKDDDIKIIPFNNGRLYITIKNSYLPLAIKLDVYNEWVATKRNNKIDQLYETI